MEMQLINSGLSADLVRPAGPVPIWLGQLHDRATTILQELAPPTKRDEAWRFTDPAALYSLQLTKGKFQSVGIEHLLLPDSYQLVFVNGVYAPNLSKVPSQGVFVGSLEELPDRYPVQNYLGQQQGSAEFFTALNTAGVEGAAVVWVEAGVAIAQLIHLLFISAPAPDPTISQPRTLVVLETNAQATLVEQYAAPNRDCVPGEQSYFTNAVSEIYLGTKAKLQHIYIQREADTAFLVAKTAVSQAAQSEYQGYSITLGGKLSRHNWEIYQTGAATTTNLNGLAMIKGEQLADTHSDIVLNFPEGKSQQLHKCVVDDQAAAVFNGRIFVGKKAQMTSAGQLSRNLLLSGKARVDTKPQLEIVADNVKCAHGATVSQLDEEEIFYLQSRGIDQASAASLLVEAAVLEVVKQIPVPTLRQLLFRCMSCKTMFN